MHCFIWTILKGDFLNVLHPQIPDFQQNFFAKTFLLKPIHKAAEANFY